MSPRAWSARRVALAGVGVDRAERRRLPLGGRGLLRRQLVALRWPGRRAGPGPPRAAPSPRAPGPRGRPGDGRARRSRAAGSRAPWATTTAPESSRCWSRLARVRTSSTSVSILVCSRPRSESSVSTRTMLVAQRRPAAPRATPARRSRAASPGGGPAGRAWCQRPAGRAVAAGRTDRPSLVGRAPQAGLGYGQASTGRCTGATPCISTLVPRCGQHVSARVRPRVGVQGCSVAQCAASTSAGPPSATASSATWCRRSAVTNASAPARRGLARSGCRRTRRTPRPVRTIRAGSPDRAHAPGGRRQRRPRPA